MRGKQLYPWLLPNLTWRTLFYTGLIFRGNVKLINSYSRLLERRSELKKESEEESHNSFIKAIQS